ncbi:SAM-dependent methyltransferase [Acaryochloris sp. 'Moss Beach']|uniref:class I SAM-dependent methyltransferase n=1 Tax=Acaryochloris sp. 'Moss Beach' TaxID=2740837 RepID=UPI0028F41B9F|nr:SAM-dependent methyltransferase [Acaryochloris sp. 'Moss Beach']UJB68048.1 SAM-dependent methyltransferase [Acaryochloris sp. 'Moss Beach']
MTHPDSFNPVLFQRIVDCMNTAPQQRMTFAEFMELALYDPEQGYYATNQVQIGVAGDFFTSPHLCPDFGELLAEQFLDMWRVMGQPKSFTLVEMGAGQGLVAADVLKYLAIRKQSADSSAGYAAFWAALRYMIVEKAEGLIAAQQRLLQPFQFAPDKVQWLRFEQLPEAGTVGCFFSNELVDALPVHQFVVQDGAVQEVFVMIDGDSQSFMEVLSTPSTDHLVEYLAGQGIDIGAGYEDGYRSEINLAALNWLETVSQKLERGYVLTIDYGYLAPQYYSPQRHQGTLQCFRRHGAHQDPYAYLGHQDITAHVNFTALEKQGLAQGLTSMGYIQQGLFLMALGLGDRLVANNNTRDITQLNEVIRRRETLQSLINPLGLGGFQVLIQGKGLNEKEQSQVLKGLQMP